MTRSTPQIDQPRARTEARLTAQLQHPVPPNAVLDTKAHDFFVVGA